MWAPIWAQQLEIVVGFFSILISAGLVAHVVDLVGTLHYILRVAPVQK